MPIQITPNRSSEILMQAFRDRDAAEQNTMKNELIKYQLQKAREQEQIYKTNPTMETTPQTVQGANPEAVQGLEKFGVQTNPEFTGAQQLDTQTPIPQWKQLDNLASRIALTPGGIEEAAKLKKLSEDYKGIESSHQVVMNAMKMSGYDWTKAQQILISQHGEGIKPMLDEVKPTMGGFEVGGKYLVHYDGKITPLPKDEGDKTDTSIRKFEQLHPELASQRGSKQYRDAFVAFTKSLSPTNYVFAGSTPDGAPVVFDPKKATFEEKPVVGGGRIQPKISPMAKDLQEGIVNAQTLIDSLNEAEQVFKPEYLTVKGRIQSTSELAANKLGIPMSKFSEERKEWYNNSKQEFLKYRKWVTGVAGGEKEMTEIAKAFPDPEGNSPTEYMANLRQTRKNAIRLQKRYDIFLRNGITPTKEQLSTIPLSSIKVTETGGVSPITEKFLRGE